MINNAAKYNINNPNNDRIKHIFIKVLFIFFYIYEINCSVFGLPTWITTRRIIFVIVLIYVLLTRPFKLSLSRSRGYVDKYLKKIFSLHGFLFLYSVLLIIFIGYGEGDHVINSIVRFVIFTIVAVYVFTEIFPSHNELFKVLLLVTLLQCTIILMGVLNDSFLMFIDSTLGQDYARYHNAGYSTGIACVAAPGALKILVGLIPCLYFMLTKRRNRFFYIICYIFIGIIATAVARTGLFISLIGLLFLLIKTSKISVVRMLKIAGVFTVLGIILLTITYAFGLGDNIQELYVRVINLQNRGIYGDFLSGYLYGENTVLPPISIETIVGTGITSGMSGNGIYVNQDGGYLRLYVAYGLPLAITFYILMLVYMNKALRGISDPIFLSIMQFMILVIFLGEFKEYFIYTQYMVFLFFLLLKLFEKNDRLMKRDNIAKNKNR